MPFCTATPNEGIVTGLIGTVDCYIADFAQGSYRDLVGPGTAFAAVFTALLTIYVALMGYQLLLGRGGLRVTDLPLIAMKTELILAFLTSWAAYQTVVYNFLFDGPQEIARVLLAQTDRLGGGFGTDIFSGLERAFYSLIDAAAVYGKQAGGNVNILQGGPALGSGLLWLSAVAMLLSTVGLILACKIVLGFLLALGPLFIGLFLFDATRGFFDGWLRTTISFALAPLATTVLSAAMLLMLSPFVTRLGALAKANRFDMGTIVTIAIVIAVFVLVMSQVMRLGLGITGGFRSIRRYNRPFSQQPSMGLATPPTVMVQRNSLRNMTTFESAVLRRSRPDAGENGGAWNISMTGDAPRMRELTDAVAAAPFASPRLGDAYRRVPVPARRLGLGPAMTVSGR